MEAGTVIAERFVIERRAGSGGASAVYRAIDRSTGSAVAVKILHELRSAGPERFIAEARVLSDLRHPAIVRYITHGVTGDHEPYLAMEWLEGEDLAQRLARVPLSIVDSVELAERVADALSQAHGRGVIHRDVKPSNLFLPEGDIARVKLLDFGVARIKTLGQGTTRAGTVVGTPGYMAPEQARGARDLDARADLFSLGCVLFECITGEPAFAGDHVMAVLAKILLDEAPRVGDLRPEVPAPLDDLVARMLAKDPAARPRDAATVARELVALRAARWSKLPERAPPAALTQSELRLLSVVARGPSQSADDRLLPALRQIVERYGGRLEMLLDGSIVATLAGSGAATDQAATAARCALALREVEPTAPMALATGRGELRRNWPAGEAIDRAFALLRSRPLEGKHPYAVRVDDVTAGLLDPRFDLADEPALTNLPGASLLLHERQVGEAARTLLGRETACVGRDRELGTLLAIYREVVSEPVARMVVVLAAAGIGKSRLRHEFLRRLRDEEDIETAPEILIASGDPIAAGSTFGMVASMLRHAAGITESDPLDVRRQRLRARIARRVEPMSVARVTEFLGEMLSTPFEDEPSVQLRAARNDPMVMGDQIRRAWEDFIRAECRERPVVLVLDDMQWGDLPSVKIVDSVMKNLGDRPVLILCLGRPELEDRFPQAWAGRAATEIRLGPLTRKASEKLVMQALHEASAETVDRIVAHAAGNAFFLEELVRSVARGVGETFPETVLAMLQVRLERLSPELRRVLRAASIFGQAFTTPGVAALLGVPPNDRALGDQMTDLLDQEYLARREDNSKGQPRRGGDLTFAHALVREAAYETLTKDDRTLGHRMAGEWLAETLTPDAIALAQHFELGAVPDHACHWYRRAAEQALEGNDLAQALAHAERAVLCAAEGEELGALRLLQAQAHRWRGEFPEAARSADEAMKALRERSAPWFTAAGEMAVASSKLGDVERLCALGGALGSALAALTGHDREAAYGGALAIAAMRTATYLYYAARADAAADLLSRAEPLALAVGETDPAVMGWAHVACATRAEFTGNPASYLEHTEAAATSFDRAGDLRNACTHTLNVGYANLELGRTDEAERALRVALESAEQMGLPNLVAVAKHNLGLALSRRGALEEAHRVEQEAIDAFAAQGDRRMAAASRAYLAQIMTVAGDFSRAEAEARIAVKDLAEGGPAHATPVRPLALATLAGALLAACRSGEALAVAEEALRTFELLKGVEEGESLVRLTYAEALERSGARELAKAAVATAASRIEVRASKISDPAHRRSFLEGIPENARTLALARAPGNEGEMKRG